MKTSIKYIVFPAILFLATSCFKEVDLEDLRPESKLVLNSVASKGEPVKASLSRTWFYTEDYPNITIEDARVSLFVNDRLIEEMTWDVEEHEYYSRGNYVSSYLPVSGDRIRIEASKDGFKDIVADEVVPGIPPMVNFVAEKIEVHDPYASSTLKNRFKMTIKDDPDAANYYLISFLVATPIYEYDSDDWTKPPVYTGEYYWKLPYIDYASEPLFGNKISIMDKVFGNDWLSGYNGRPFSDEQINGKEYTITLEESSYSGHWQTESETLPDSARVYLYSISESYYRYLTDLNTLSEGSLNNDLANAGLAEPIRVFSNIKGGLGIFGTACVDSLTVAVQKSN